MKTMKTKVFPCVCKHTFQDQRYGKGNRVYLLGTKKPGVDTWSCSVCGRSFEKQQKKAKSDGK